MTWDDALSKTILYLHNLNRYQNPPTTSCLLSFIKRSHIFVGPQPNQTGPLNIAGGLEGEGNDLGSHHTSLETEIHHRQTDRRTDKSWGGEPTSLSVLSPLHPLKKKVKHWLCRPQPPAHSLASSTTYSDLPSLLLSAFWPPCPRASWGSSGHLPPNKGPTRPCLPIMWDSHSCPTLFEVRG